MAVPRGVEPLSLARQARIISDIRWDHMAGPEGFEPSTTVLETVMITISLRSYLVPQCVCLHQFITRDKPRSCGQYGATDRIRTRTLSLEN